jgi:two-component system, OmpR family, response regulator
VTRAPLQRVLLVEDDAHIRTVAEMALSMVGGFEVRACGSGAEAIDALSTFRPELVLLDVMMPGMDGPALLAELRRRPDSAGLQAIFLTARVQRAEIDALLALGALGVIAKPFDPMKLADTVRAAWARAK